MILGEELYKELTQPEIIKLKQEYETLFDKYAPPFNFDEYGSIKDYTDTLKKIELRKSKI